MAGRQPTSGPCVGRSCWNPPPSGPSGRFSVSGRHRHDVDLGRGQFSVSARVLSRLPPRCGLCRLVRHVGRCDDGPGGLSGGSSSNTSIHHRRHSGGLSAPPRAARHSVRRLPLNEESWPSRTRCQARAWTTSGSSREARTRERHDTQQRRSGEAHRESRPVPSFNRQLTRFQTEPSERPIDLALQATRDAVAKAGIATNEIDFVIYAGVARGWLEPATAHALQGPLDLDRATCFDVLDGCASWLRAMHIANSFIRSGEYRRGLIVNSECGFGGHGRWQFDSVDQFDAYVATYRSAKRPRPRSSVPTNGRTTSTVNSGASDAPTISA